MDRLLWTQIQDFGPSLRLGAQMSYDSGRDRMVLFGGDYGQSSLNDTWEFDGALWGQVEDFGPPGRAIGGMCYDQIRKKTVLFGGEIVGVGDAKGTWEWDGQYWVQVFEGGPPPQNIPISYDSTNHYTILVTRPDATGNSATWSWNGTQWTQLDEASFDGSPLLTYDPVGKQMLLCASSANGTVTYAWTGNTWKQVSDIGPAFSFLSAYLYSDGQEALAYLPGSFQTWSWSGKGWLQRQSMGPSARTGVSIAGDTKRNRLILFGGQIDGGATVSETWALQRFPGPATA
jgi:hypothetical protein